MKIEIEAVVTGFAMKPTKIGRVARVTLEFVPVAGDIEFVGDLVGQLAAVQISRMQAIMLLNRDTGEVRDEPPSAAE